MHTEPFGDTLPHVTLSHQDTLAVSRASDE